MADLFHGRLLRFIAIGAIVYAIVAWATPAPALILVLNDLLLAAALFVCISYAPLLPEALKSRAPTNGQYLGAGIFFVSICMLMLRIVASAARDFGWAELLNTDALTGAYAIGFLGTLMHLLALGVKDGRVPPDRWVKTGGIVAVGVFLALICWSMHAALTIPTVVQLR